MVKCGSCQQQIPDADINIGLGVAMCRACERLWKLSDLATPIELQGTVDALERVKETPAGCIESDDGVERSVTVPFNRKAIGIGMLCFGFLWDAFVCAFLFMAMTKAGHSNVVVSPAPEIAPAGGASSSTQIPLWAAMMPFFLSGTIIPLIGVIMTFGQTRVVRRGDDARVESGLGALRWTRRFNAGAVREIKLGQTTWQENGRLLPVVVIHADREIRLGSRLTNEQRAWLLRALERMFPTPSQASLL